MSFVLTGRLCCCTAMLLLDYGQTSHTYSMKNVATKNMGHTYTASICSDRTHNCLALIKYSKHLHYS